MRRSSRKAPKARSKDEKCITKRCLNRKAVKFTRYRQADGLIKTYQNFLNHCWKCRARMLKERHPATYVLNAIRQRAKARKLPFDITLEQFKEFCKQTRYLELRGRSPTSLTIDRIDHDKGYHIWNIQVKTFYENCTNGHTVPGKECKQNERKPETYEYDFTGPDPDYKSPTEENQPF